MPLMPSYAELLQRARVPTITAGPMGQPVPIDRPAIAAAPHPAWLNPVYKQPASTQPAGTTYSWYRNQVKLGPGQILGYQPGRGYYAKTGTVRAPAVNPNSPEAQLAALYKKVMGTIETPAEAEARVKREIAEESAAQTKLIQDTYARQRADALAAMQAQSAAGQAAAEMSKGLISQVGGEYNAAAGEISGLSGGLTGAFNAATASDVKAANKALGRLGAPGLTEGGISGYGGDLQAGVENYRAGTLGSQLASSAGEAATFGLAGETAAQDVKMTQEAAASYQGLIYKINEAESQAVQELAAGNVKTAHEYLAEANDARTKAITLASGLITARAGLTGTTKPQTRMVNGSLYQLDSATNTWKRVVTGTNPATARAKAAIAKAKLPNATLSKIYHHIVDSNGNAILGPDGKIQPVAGDASTAKVNLQMSRALGRWVAIGSDGTVTPIPSLNKPGMPKPPPFFKPGTKKKSGDTVTNEDRQQAGEEIRKFGLQQRAVDKVKEFNQRQIAAGAKRTVGGKKVDWADAPMTVQQAAAAPPATQAMMGLTPAEGDALGDPRSLQDIYIDLARSIGGKQAWVMIRKYYPHFGQGYYK